MSSKLDFLTHLNSDSAFSPKNFLKFAKGAVFLALTQNQLLQFNAKDGQDSLSKPRHQDSPKSWLVITSLRWRVFQCTWIDLLHVYLLHGYLENQRGDHVLRVWFLYQKSIGRILFPNSPNCGDHPDPWEHWLSLIASYVQYSKIQHKPESKVEIFKSFAKSLSL